MASRSLPTNLLTYLLIYLLLFSLGYRTTSIVPVSREKGVNGEVSASTSADERMHLMWRMGTYALTLAEAGELS